VFAPAFAAPGGHDIFLECPGCRELGALVRLGGGRRDHAQRLFRNGSAVSAPGFAIAQKAGSSDPISRNHWDGMFGWGGQVVPTCYPQLFSRHQINVPAEMLAAAGPSAS